MITSKTQTEVKNMAQDLLEDCKKLKSLLELIRNEANNNKLEMYADSLDISLAHLDKIQTKIDLGLYLKLVE